MKCFNDYIVDIDILKNNCWNIKKLIGKNVKFCAIVKADAYGLGCEAICKSLKGLADFFAVACLKEALKIREFDKTTKILILGVVSPKEYEICAENNISISIGTLEQLEKINNEKLNIHLQVNTGLNRFGFRSLVEFKKALKLIDSKENVKLEGVYSHFATKEQDVKFINIQFFKFLQFKNLVKDKNVICHIANSFATLQNEKFHLEMVRNGFSLYYGYKNIFNKPVLTIKSKVINITTIKKGDSIGYDRTYVATKKMKVAVISIGYADGFDRRLSNNFQVIINDKKCPVVGLVCMDVFMVDISDVNAQVGDEVILLGKSKNHQITLFDYAKSLNTSPYEVLLKFNHKRMNYIIKMQQNE